MRRLPIYFLIDVSESMVGEPLDCVERGIRSIVQELRCDPTALETAWLSVIAFAGRAQTLVPLTEICNFYPPIFNIGGGTALGAAIDYLAADIKKNVTRTTTESKGDWKPIIFLLTDGAPTDDCAEAIARWNAQMRSHVNLVAIGIGESANVVTLKKITEDVMLFKDAETESFARFFKWVSSSIQTASQSVAEAGGRFDLRPPSGINLKKVSDEMAKSLESAPATVDDNFAAMRARCQQTRKDYILKYRRSFGNIEDMTNYFRNDYQLVGAYNIDGEAYDSLSQPSGVASTVSTSQLYGRPTCPRCGNQHALVVCQCGKVFCAGADGVANCPWCGMEGTLEFVEEGLDVGRTRG